MLLNTSISTYLLKILLSYKRFIFKEITFSLKILTFPFLCSPRDLLITTSTKMLYSTKMYHAGPALKQINFSSTNSPQSTTFQMRQINNCKSNKSIHKVDHLEVEANSCVMLAFGTSLIFHFSDYFSEKQYQQQTKLKRKTPTNLKMMLLV